jgi:hypothetical protein
MFGSMGSWCVAIFASPRAPARIMCRIDPAKHGAAIKRKGFGTVIMKGRTCQGYVYVDAGALTAKEALLYWVGQALEFNRTLPEIVK